MAPVALDPAFAPDWAGALWTVHTQTMSIERTVPERTIRMAARARDEADSLLVRLIIDRQFSEQRYAAAGKSDPIKNLTGTSAMDRAIESTRVMISHMDDLLEDLRGELAHAGAETNGGRNGAAASRSGNGPVVTVSSKLPFHADSPT